MIRYWIAGLMLVSTFSGIWSRDCSQYGERRILFCDNVVTIDKPPVIKDSIYNYWKYFQTAAGVKEVLDILDSIQSCCKVLSVADFTIPDDTVTSDLAYGLSRVAAPPADSVTSADYILYGTVSGGDLSLHVLRLESARTRALVKADTQVLCYSFNPSGIGRTAAGNLGEIYDTIIAFEKKSGVTDELDGIARRKGSFLIVNDPIVQSAKYNTVDRTLQIRYSTFARQTATFAIVNLSGKVVARIVRNDEAAENNMFSWNTAAIPMGGYLLRMESGVWSRAQKITIVK